jgi:penicillin-binding protein 2
MGIDTMNQYLTSLGFGERTGLEIGGTDGILAGPLYRQEINGEEWQPGNTLQAAIGQSDHMASPVQLACYLSTISNGGTRYSAHLLHSVYAPGSAAPTFVYRQSEETVLSRLTLSEEVRATVFAGMREMVTSHATANRNLSSLPVAVGGKTGTAQTSEACENALFVCAAPFDAPEIVVSVVLEQGYSGEYASLTAARILEKYYGVEK